MSTPSSPLKAVRGTRDLLPPETALWARVESVARDVFSRYGFGEIRTPIFEATELFARGVGEETDIVSKEMYTWEDGGRFDKDGLAKKWLSRQAGFNQELSRKFLDADRADKVLTSEDGKSVVFAMFRPAREKFSYDALHDILKANSKNNKFGVNEFVGKYVIPQEWNTDPEWPFSTTEQTPTLTMHIEGVAGRFFLSTQSLTLRPENTAGVVRAYIEHKLGDSGQLQKLFYLGPQFRRERPQRGRYRQFWQIGAEVLGPPSAGSESPIRDAEVLEMLATLLDELGVKGWRLELNSVGSATDRPRYLAALREALAPVKHQMSEDNQRRAETNPLRVLDSKAPEDQALIDALPKIADYLDEASRDHFAQVLAALDACSVPYTINPRLVRGLDYYTRTTFEFTVPSGDASGLGTQNALLGGGRYDGLSEMLGGPRAPGIGFAIGQDRLILTLQAQASARTPTEPGAPHLDSEMWASAQKLDAYIAPLGPERNPAALTLARELRRAGLSVEVGDGTFRLKRSFEAADRVARHIILLGEDEAQSDILTVKTFATSEQTKVPRAELADALRS
jgi:histidyl-tRNA synthetase